jgi:hypothetical protein
VKPASLLLLLTIGSSLMACNTQLTMRRNLYSPKKGSGYWTTRYQKLRNTQGIFGVSNSDHRGAGPGPETGIFGISHPTNPKPEGQ